MASRYLLRALVCAYALSFIGPLASAPVAAGDEEANATVSRSGKATVARKRAKLVARLPFTAGCPAGADAKCRLVGNLSGRSGAGIASNLGGVKNSLGPGKRWRVKLPLTRRATKILRKERRLKALALVAVQTPGGKHTVETANVTLRRPAGK